MAASEMPPLPPGAHIHLRDDREAATCFLQTGVMKSDGQMCPSLLPRSDEPFRATEGSLISSHWRKGSLWSDTHLPVTK